MLLTSIKFSRNLDTPNFIFFSLKLNFLIIKIQHSKFKEMETIDSMLNYLGIDFSEKLQNKFKGILSFFSSNLLLCSNSVSIFEEEKIDFEAFLLLNINDLHDLGFNSQERRDLINYIKNWERDNGKYFNFYNFSKLKLFNY